VYAKDGFVSSIDSVHMLSSKENDMSGPGCRVVALLCLGEDITLAGEMSLCLSSLIVTHGDSGIGVIVSMKPS
jgi:hypothetical protein